MNNLLYTALLIFFVACTTNKDTTTDPATCNTEATVKDFTGLDGCKMLLVLDNGDKLLPAKIKDSSFKLRDGQRVRFGYKELKDAISICMTEKMSIEVTCIEEIAGIPNLVECADVDKPQQVKWMNDALIRHNAAAVKKYKYKTNGWAYLFYAGDAQYLYDCQGTQICEFRGLGPKDCVYQHLREENDKGKYIYKKQ